MKKVGIITITGLGNYGNRLQNYALQHVIEKNCFCQCETFINKSCRMKGYIKNIVMPKKGVLTEREQIFQQFNDRFIHFSNIKINNILKNKHLHEYERLICGSDQIWNSDYPENDRANFGFFFSDLKSISYAASFGTDMIADNKKKRYAKYLKQMEMISVREDKGKEIAEQLTGRKDICVHVDPTLLLTPQEWEEVEKKPQLYNGEKYILKYFLGSANSEITKQLEQYAKKKNFKVIDIISKDSPYYNIGPSEFLYLEHNAELIVTDSFHSCVFAIIFEKPFIVAERMEINLQNMGSRIDTLLQKFSLKDRKYINDDNFDNKVNASIDYHKIHQIIEKEKERSLQYLKKYV